MDACRKPGADAYMGREGLGFSGWRKTMSRKARESRASGAYFSYVTERKTKRNTADRVFRQPELNLTFRASYAILPFLFEPTRQA